MIIRPLIYPCRINQSFFSQVIISNPLHSKTRSYHYTSFQPKSYVIHHQCTCKNVSIGILVFQNLRGTASSGHGTCPQYYIGHWGWGVDAFFRIYINKMC